MRLKFLGGFNLLDQRGETVQFAHKRGQALLAYLALKDSHIEDREVVVDLLWRDRFKKQTQAA